jgi:hypothetical protein
MLSADPPGGAIYFVKPKLSKNLAAMASHEDSSIDLHISRKSFISKDLRYKAASFHESGRERHQADYRHPYRQT